MSNILNFKDKPFSDEDIIKKEYHSYIPYTIMMKKDNTTKSRFIEGNVKNISGEEYSNARLRNNCEAYLFDEIRYEINGVEIERTRYLGNATTVKSIIEDLSMNSVNFHVPLKTVWDMLRILIKLY